MKIIEANIYALSIPFNFSFGHSLNNRDSSDSILLELVADSGETGYGEGVARPYVTGETVQGSISHIRDILLPAILKRPLRSIDTATGSYTALSWIDALLPTVDKPGVLASNASRCAVELALMDCLLRGQEESLSSLLPPSCTTVQYSVVISSGGGIEETVEFAEKAKQAGLGHIKIKVGNDQDHERIKAARDILGPSVSIRLDANGAFSVPEALRFISSVEKFHIDSIEEPIKRGDVPGLAQVKANSSIPVMVDESLVTLDDAKILLQNNACDYFNLRVSKCGGIYKTLAIAEFARENALRCQLGCQVGETAILSAAGRHVAAFVPNILFSEGSYSTRILTEDITFEEIAFGKGGKAPVLTGDGLGVTVNKSTLQKYAREIIRIS